MCGERKYETVESSKIRGLRLCLVWYERRGACVIVRKRGGGSEGEIARERGRQDGRKRGQKRGKTKFVAPTRVHCTL